MAVKIGYLLPTREFVMAGRLEARPIVDLAVEAEAIGLDSVWVGDSVTAKPRHDWLVMLSAIAARTSRVKVGTAVLLPLLRNPVLLAQQLATLDQLAEGRVVVGVGIGNQSPAGLAEFDAVGAGHDKRVGRLIEYVALMRALWQGGAVTWPPAQPARISDAIEGRWPLAGQGIGITPYTVDGPPVWAAGNAPAALKRCARYFDGYFPSGPSDPAVWAGNWQAVQASAGERGRDAPEITGAAYLTLAIDDNQAAADSRMNAYLEGYYNRPADQIRAYQGCYTGNK